MKLNTSGIIGQSTTLADVFKMLAKVAPTDSTVLVTGGRQPTETAMEEAALLAARHSKAKDSAQVPVDYTQIRHVSKPQGAKPGMVIYVNYKTMYVNPAQQG